MSFIVREKEIKREEVHDLTSIDQGLMNIFLKSASVWTVSRVFILGPSGSFCSHELYECTNAHKHDAHPEELGDGKYHDSKYISYFQNPDNPT